MAYFITAALAALCFLASLLCNLLGWLQIEPPLGKTTFVLHAGIFLFWLPLVLLANRTMPKNAKNNIDHLFAVLPKWVGRASAVVFTYTIINFLLFILATTRFPKRGVPLYLELRGFSGHWMLFYGMAAVGFTALGKLARKPTTPTHPSATKQIQTCPRCHHLFPPSSPTSPQGLRLCPTCAHITNSGNPKTNAAPTPLALACPDCYQTLPPTAINLPSNAAICRHCNTAFHVDKLFHHAATRSQITSELPRGVFHQTFDNGWQLEIHCRSPYALAAIPFTIFWVSALVGATIASFRSGAICCAIFILPIFYWGAYVLCSYTFMTIAGRTTLRIHADDAELSNGRGWRSRRQHFSWSTCRDVHEPIQPDNTSKRAGIDAAFNALYFDTESRTLLWGQVLPVNRRHAISPIIRSHLAYQGTRVPLDQ